MECFQRPLRRKHWTVHKFSSGLRGSKEEKWALKIILILGVRQQVVPTRMSKEFENKSTRIIGTQLTRSQKLVSWSYCQRILTVDLNMRRLAAKFVPRLLTQDQKNTCLTLCQELKNQIESDPNFLSKVITGDESWCYGYDPETKQASNQWKKPTSPRPKKTKTIEVKCENDAHCFFRCLRNRAPGIRSSWTDCQPGILLGGFEAIERECAKKTPRSVEIGWLVSPSWQCPSSHSFVCDPVFGLSGMDRRSPPILFTGPRPLSFLFILDNKKKNIERKEICHRGGGENSFAGGTQQHQASAVPEMLHTVGKKTGQVYCLEWGVFWRELSVFCSKCK